MTTMLLTGAARGLGREVARQLGEQGHDVVIAARSATAAAAELGYPVRALPVGLDITDAAAVSAGVGLLDSLDVLINNAAAFVDWTETATDADLAAAHQVIDTNL